MRVIASRPPTQGERITALEERADAHDKIAGQVGEMYEVFSAIRGFNWLAVKIAGVVMGILGGIAVVLTIAANIAKLIGH